MFCFFWPWDMWDLSFPTHSPCIGRWGPSHWTGRKASSIHSWGLYAFHLVPSAQVVCTWPFRDRNTTVLGSVWFPGKEFKGTIQLERSIISPDFSYLGSQLAFRMEYWGKVIYSKKPAFCSQLDSENFVTYLFWLAGNSAKSILFHHMVTAFTQITSFFVRSWTCSHSLGCLQFIWERKKK